MIEVPMPKTLKVGGFDYSILAGGDVDRDLQARQKWGEHFDMDKKVKLVGNCSPQQFSHNLIHELFIHAVDVVYLGDGLTEAQVVGLAVGIHQILEQLGVRFVKGEEE